MPPLSCFALLLRPLRRLPPPRSRSLSSASDAAAATSGDSASGPGLDMDLAAPTFTIWGSNTGVGKTLVSAGLVAAAALAPSPSSFLYLKPLQTGFPSDSDSRFVFRTVSSLFRRRLSGDPAAASLLASHHLLRASPAAAAAAEPPSSYEAARIGTGERDDGELNKLVCKTLYAWNEAISPHLAVEREGMAVGDAALRAAVGSCLGSFVRGLGDEWKGTRVWRVIETAGGVASPGPSGTLQCDLYRPFRLPGILVGDGRLGGISSTISAYESLTMRGYDVTAVIFEDNGLSNEVPLLSYLRNRVPVFVLPPIPKDPSNDLMEWFCESASIFSSLQETMISFHSERIQRLRSMKRKARNILWWPFTQHDLVPEELVTVIDSRCGESFSIHKVRHGEEMIVPQFDACGSWWTQGPDSTLQFSSFFNWDMELENFHRWFQTELARDMGYSAARYGHVMFPENVYEPALHCAEVLLGGVGKGWASRTFYSDNGSTAIEIALKMAFRKYLLDHGILLDYEKGILSERCIQLKVLALNGSYHGDTLGAMEAQAPSSYTTFLQQPWYSGRGLFLQPPITFISNEIWNISLPDSLQSDQLKPENLRFSSLDDVFSQCRDSLAIARIYSEYISEHLSKHSELSPSTHIGALIVEPGK
ncbi:Bifunctional dethiobiotin synthetase/7,8-diamino-pelargonic acid aminotransferase, mitochondrial [Ananas comosus]|uniref:Bifunctional dethiobiotin synthetase/7,8-diamino-pelargonic acid aminotransferase, mitochondrial n=1 Tax=Ananas comosus TaxID=4615 RepID=A0A199UYL3_ANACO|nr:Bifunctional dethiobiotin synthetase/7,8-diamino-pelargonic acid aminotransferase, mitochondrial [Ananas comosus]